MGPLLIHNKTHNNRTDIKRDLRVAMGSVNLEINKLSPTLNANQFRGRLCNVNVFCFLFQSQINRLNMDSADKSTDEFSI